MITSLDSIKPCEIDNPLVVDFFVWYDGCYVSRYTNLVINKLGEQRIKHTHKEVIDKAREMMAEAKDEYSKQFFINVIKHGTPNLPNSCR